jgi:hypothetical protein
MTTIILEGVTLYTARGDMTLVLEPRFYSDAFEFPPGTPITRLSSLMARDWTGYGGDRQ